MNLEFIRSRSRSNGEGTYGELRIGGHHFAYTVEQPWNNNVQGHSCIPVGLGYKLLPYNSPAHGATVVFHNPALNIYGTPAMIPHGVAGRSLCEIHSANWSFQLKGCVALGDALTDIPPHGLGVTESAKTVERLKEIWGDRIDLTADVCWDQAL